jgi:hypothetical protein
LTITLTGKPGPNRQRRLNVQIAPDDLLSSLIQRIRRAQAERLKNIGIAAAICAGTEFRTNIVERSAALNSLAQ